MRNNLLPVPAEVSASFTEMALPVIHTKALVDRQPSQLSYGVDGLIEAVVAAENIVNTALAVRRRDPLTAIITAGLAYVYGEASLAHARKIRNGVRTNWDELSKNERSAERAATVGFTLAQIFVNKRLGK